MITANQCRLCRKLLNWSAADLARRAQLGVATIVRFENERGSEETKQAIALALWRAGVDWERGALRYPARWDDE